MAEIHVGEGQQYATLEAAAAAARPGDEVIVHEGVYRETLRPPRGTTWRAADGEFVAIDGGWVRGEPANSAGSGVLINQADVKLVGLTFQNWPGRGVSVAAGGDNFVMERCAVRHTYHGLFGANGQGTTIRGIRITDCELYEGSLSWEYEQGSVQGCFLFRFCDDVAVRRTKLYAIFGEGLAAGVGSGNATGRPGILFEDCEVHTAMHGMAYVNRCKGVTYRRCVFFQTRDPRYLQGDGDDGACVVVGDEMPPKGRWASDFVRFEKCLFVGRIGVRNNLKAGQIAGNIDGYLTAPEHMEFVECTIIADGRTKAGITIDESESPPPRVRGRFERCVIVLDTIADDSKAFRNGAAGVVFEGNAVTKHYRGMGGSNVIIEPTALVNPFAVATGTAHEHDFNIDNYRPVAGGPLVGPDGRALYGALEPLAVEPPPPPPPPPDPEPVDWPALLEKAEGVGARLATMGAAGNAAREHLAAATEQLAVMSLAHEDAVDDMAALLTMLGEYQSG